MGEIQRCSCAAHQLGWWKSRRADRDVPCHSQLLCWRSTAHGKHNWKILFTPVYLNNPSAFLFLTQPDSVCQPYMLCGRKPGGSSLHSGSCLWLGDDPSASPDKSVHVGFSPWAQPVQVQRAAMVRWGGLISRKIKLDYFRENQAGASRTLLSHWHFGVLTVLPGQQLPMMVMPVTYSDQGWNICKEIYPSKQPHLHGCYSLRVEGLPCSIRPHLYAYERGLTSCFLGLLVYVSARGNGNRDWEVPHVLQKIGQHHQRAQLLVFQGVFINHGAGSVKSMLTSSQGLLSELVFYQLACFKKNQITCQIVFKIIGRPIHFLIGLFSSLLPAGTGKQVLASVAGLLHQNSIWDPTGDTLLIHCKAKEGGSEENRKGSHRNIVSDALVWGFTSCPILTQLFINFFISVKSWTHKQTKKTHLQMFQTLMLWDEESGKAFLLWPERFFADFVLKPLLCNCYSPEQ